LQGIETRADIGVIPDNGKARQTPIRIQKQQPLVLLYGTFYAIANSACLYKLLIYINLQGVLAKELR
jgi:hypothetical protein